MVALAGITHVRDLLACVIPKSYHWFDLLPTWVAREMLGGSNPTATTNKHKYSNSLKTNLANSLQLQGMARKVTTILTLGIAFVTPYFSPNSHLISSSLYFLKPRMGEPISYYLLCYFSLQNDTLPKIQPT